jgi:hypothetical protein
MGSGVDNSIYWIISHIVTTIRYYTFKTAVCRTHNQLLNCLERRLPDESSRSQGQSQSHIATNGQSVRLGVEPHLGLMTRYLLLLDSYDLVYVGRPL